MQDRREVIDIGPDTLTKFEMILAYHTWQSTFKFRASVMDFDYS